MRTSLLVVLSLSLLLAAPEPLRADAPASEAQGPMRYHVEARRAGFVPFVTPPGVEAPGWVATGPDGRGLHVVRLDASLPGTRPEDADRDLYAVVVPTFRGGRKGPMPIALTPIKWNDVRIEALEGGAAPGEGATRLPAARTFDQDLMYAQVAAGRPRVYAGPHPWWFFTRLLAGETRTVFFGTASSEAGHMQTIEAQVTPTHAGEVALRASWGGVDLGVRKTRIPATDTPQAAPVLTWRIDGKDVPTDAKAEFILQDVSPAPPPRPRHDVSDGRGMVWIERVTIHGTTRIQSLRRLRAFDLYLGDEPLGERFEIEGVAPLACILTRSNELLPVRVGAVQAEAGAASTPRRWHIHADGAAEHAGARLLVQARDVPQVPRPYPLGPEPIEPTRDVEHLIVATPPLLEEAKRLAAHRRAAGLPSVAISSASIWNHYGAGEAHPALLERFLRARAAASSRPLRYLLLVGDATLDRGDLVEKATIPTPMRRTMYNGATASDHAYVANPAAPFAVPSVGRLPFEKPEVLRAFVDRLIRYETTPPPAATRRLLRFVTSEGRFGTLIDSLIERIFRNVLADYLPPAYEIEITFASQSSPFLWPPREFGDKVLDALNEGSLFYTYIGHGFAHGFDQLHVGRERFPILTVKDLPRVDIQGVPPVMLVLACTTARFDYPRSEGIGEGLLQDPEGPIAYWGATRICHPAANSLVGYRLAARMGTMPPSARLGDLLRESWRDVTDPARFEKDAPQRMLRGGLALFLGGVPTSVLAREGREMYALLGDPATKVAFPRNDLVVETKVESVAEGADAKVRQITAVIRGPLAEGTELHVSLERQRNRAVHRATAVDNVLDPASAPTIRANHAAMNDWALVRRTGIVEGGRVEVTFPMPDDTRGLLVKAWARTDTDIHQGAALVSE